MRARVLSGLLVVVALWAAPAAQQPETPQPRPQPEQQLPPTFRTGVGIVRVDVTVSDRADRPVDDLTVEDFEVREDGTPQTVQTLQFVRLTGQPAAGDDESLEIRSPEHAAQEAARDDVRLFTLFVDDYHLRNGPLYDVRLRQMLRRFVDAEMKPTDLFAVMGPLTPMSDLGLTRAKQDIFDRIERIEGRLGGLPIPRSALEESQMYLGPGERSRIRTQISISALKSLVDYLGTLKDGRKTVLYVSEGPALMGADGSRHYDAVREVVTSANRGNVVIHTLDPRDLSTRGFPGDANSTLALDTGGRALGRSNDFSRGLRAVIADASAYYLLGYMPTRPANDGKFHKIDVKVRRTGARVLARRGYWAATVEETTPRPPAPSAPADVTAALGALATPPGRQVEWWLGAERSRDGQAMLILSWEHASPPASADVAALRLTLPDDEGEYRAVATSGEAGPWQVRAASAARPLRARITVEDREGRNLESWTQDVDLSLPPAIAIDAPRVMVSQSPRSAVGAANAPVARRRFRRTERVALLVAIHGPAGSEPHAEAELLNRHGTRLVSLPASRVDGHHVRVDLPLANLAQAEYVVRVTARDGQDSASEAVSFAVVP